MDFDEEWLIANRNGSYSSSTVSFANTRTYHGILIKSSGEFYDRYVLLAKLFEEAVFSGKRYSLDTNYYEGAVSPEGFRFMEDYSAVPYPVVTFNLDGNRIKKTLIIDTDSDSVVIRYEFSNRIPDSISLFPLLAFRSFHKTIKAGEKKFYMDDEGDYYRFSDGTFSVGISKAGKFVNKDYWYYNFRYPVEEERGTNSREDLYMPGFIEIKNIENPLDITVTADENPVPGFSKLLEKFKKRGNNNERDQSISALRRNSSNFLTHNNIIAGFHWFGPWGRDAFVSLPGLVLIPGNYELARNIFGNYIAKMNKGLIVNSSYGDSYQYSADSSLWFIYSLYKYYQYSSDNYFISATYDKVKEIIDAYIEGNDDFSLDGKMIKVKNAPMTWMDAKDDGIAFTPRIGKPVDINALWYNALKSFIYFSNIAAKRVDDRVVDIVSDFQKTFMKEYIVDGKIADVIDPVDTSFRPNFLFAYSLPFSLMNEKIFLDKSRSELATPYGIRSLSPQDPGFRGSYAGPQIERDKSYHNGTVWPWLAGPYITAMVHNGYDAQDLYRYFSPLYSMAKIPEIFDGLNPEKPKGCIMQAWSYAELIRAYHEDISVSGRRNKIAGMKP